MRLAKSTDDLCDKMSLLLNEPDAVRENAGKVIEMLIAYLDLIAGNVDVEDGDDDGGGEDAEPSLGSFEHMINQSESWQRVSDWMPPEVHAEQDDTYAEPSRGFLKRHCNSYGYGRDASGNQEWLCQGVGEDLEEEHDGAEPTEYAESSLGSFERPFDQRASWDVSRSSVFDAEHDNCEPRNRSPR